MSHSDLPDSIAPNVAYWTRANTEHADARAGAAWAASTITWGVFNAPEEHLGSPLGDVAGLDVVELGCGTAYFSACWRGVVPGRWAWTPPRPSS